MRLAARLEPDNFETSYALGETLRLQSWQGNANYKAQAIEAMAWLAQAMKSNPHDPFIPLRYGMCMDWVGRASQSTCYFKRACALDPRGQYEATYEGWHYIQLGDYQAAKVSLYRAMQPAPTDLALGYLAIVNDRLAHSLPSQAK